MKLFNDLLEILKSKKFKRFFILPVCIIANIFLFLIPAFKNPYGTFSVGSFVFFLIMLSVAIYYTVIKKPKLTATDVLDNAGN